MEKKQNRKAIFTFEMDADETTYISITEGGLTHFEVLAFLEVAKQECLKSMMEKSKTK